MMTVNADGEDADGERDARAVDDAREDVATEVVRAHRVLERGRLQPVLHARSAVSIAGRVAEALRDPQVRGERRERP